jgi:hypothetical protein
MTISKASGLSFTEIKSEFGGDGDPSLSEYYRNGSYVTSNNSSVPTSGGGRSISFSQFHGAIKALLVEYQIIGGGGWRRLRQGQLLRFWQCLKRRFL